MTSKHLSIQFVLGAVLGSVIACSPTRFAQSKNESTLCDGVTSCVVESQSIDIVQSFKVGAGKVDILFVTDNSASMSKNQVSMAAKFSGFVQALDSKEIDYRIAITTTDLKKVTQDPLVNFANGNKFITSGDSDRSTLFQNAIYRQETIACEDLITTSFGTLGPIFPIEQYNPGYNAKYNATCPSPDTRGIYTAYNVINANSNSFIRGDANLNIILISNDDVRKGAVKEDKDKATTFASMMQQSYPSKFWNFNSIIVKDSTCAQAQTLKTASNQVVMSYNKANVIVPAIAGGIGLEYANLSNSAARDIDNNPRPRGKILDICESSYSNHFATMATQISDSSRMFTLKCTPSAEPVVTPATVPHTWSGDKITFTRGSEGIPVSIKYTCYTGPT